MRIQRTLFALVLVALVALQAPLASAAVGTPGAVWASTDDVGTGAGTTLAASAVNETDGPPDPASDVVGWENGYWYNESIDVDQSDGLTDAEIRAYRSRAMARVEYIREREFQQDVPVSVISREEFQRRNANQSNESAAHADWNDQVWEALFIVGEDTNTSNAMQDTTGSSVAGYYSPSRDEIVVVSDAEGDLTISNSTLIHEYTHALQDQYFNLSSPRLGGQTQDTQLSTNGLTEGEANLVQKLYQQRCGAEWSCVRTPSSGGGGVPDDFNWGIYVTIFQPYSDGPVWVNQQRTTGGWDAVTAAYENPPQSTEQIIHLTDDPVPNLTVANESTDGWLRFPDQGVNGSDTAGEASIFAMFWYQSAPSRLGGNNAGAIQWQSITRTSGPFDVYNYTSGPSDGWGNDKIVPYKNGEKRGYVWKSVWDSETDAQEFVDGYMAILSSHGAEEQGPNTYVVPDGKFADAFYVERTGDTVLVVNGPTVDDLPNIHPAAQAEEPADGDGDGDGGTGDDGGDGDGGDGDGGGDGGTGQTTTTTTDSDGQSGFGFGAALVAVLATLVALARRRS